MTFSPTPVRHRRIILLLICLFFLPGCQGPTAVVKPDGAGQPRTVEPSPAHPPVTLPSPAPTLTAAPPTATPLPKLEAPLVWYAQGAAPENAPARLEELNKALLAQGLNVHLDVRYIETGLFEGRMAEIRAAGEDWDLVSLSGAQYDLWQSQGALLPLPPGSIPEQAWEALDRGGQVYAFPVPQAWAKPRGISIRADAVQAFSLQNDLENLRGFRDLTPLLEKIQAAVESGTLQNSGVAGGENLQHAACSAVVLFPEAAGYGTLWGPLVARADSSGAVVNWYASAEFEELASLRRAWQEAGFLPDEALTPDQLLNAYREGRCLMEIGHLVYPGSDARQAARYGYEWIDVPLTPRWITTEQVLSSVTGVNARIADDSERARRAALVLERVYSDEEIFRLLSDLLGWESRVSFAEIERWNAGAQPAPGLGFVFDARPVGAEAAALTGAGSEYIEPLASGQRPDIERALKSLGSFLDAAGMPQIQEELEAQYAAWQSAQK